MAFLENLESSMADDEGMPNKKVTEAIKEMLEDPEVRFAALLDEFGKLLAGGLKENINLRLNDAQMDEVCKELASRVEKRKKYTIVDDRTVLFSYSDSVYHLEDFMGLESKWRER